MLKPCANASAPPFFRFGSTSIWYTAAMWSSGISLLRRSALLTPPRPQGCGLVEGLDESVQFRAVAGELDGVGVVRDVDDAAAEDVGHALHVLAVLLPGAHLDEHQLALDVLGLGKIDHLHHVDQLVELLGDLLDHVLGAGGDDGHARQRRILRRRDGERFDVVAARGKQPRDARQRPGLVLDQHRDDVTRHRSSERIISVIPLPPGIIGYTFSAWSVMKSRNTSSFVRAHASRSAGSTSPGFSTSMPRCPWPSA